jgi:hypothetical protein
MNALDVRQRLVNDYSTYVQSFINAGKKRIGQHVFGAITSGLLWPDPLMQLTPSFEPGSSIDELIQSKVSVAAVSGTRYGTRLGPPPADRRMAD